MNNTLLSAVVVTWTLGVVAVTAICAVVIALALWIKAQKKLAKVEEQNKYWQFVLEQQKILTAEIEDQSKQAFANLENEYTVLIKTQEETIVELQKEIKKANLEKEKEKLQKQELVHKKQQYDELVKKLQEQEEELVALREKLQQKDEKKEDSLDWRSIAENYQKRLMKAGKKIDTVHRQLIDMLGGESVAFYEQEIRYVLKIIQGEEDNG